MHATHWHHLVNRGSLYSRQAEPARGTAFLPATGVLQHQGPQRESGELLYEITRRSAPRLSARIPARHLIEPEVHNQFAVAEGSCSAQPAPTLDSSLCNAVSLELFQRARLHHQRLRPAGEVIRLVDDADVPTGTAKLDCGGHSCWSGANDESCDRCHAISSSANGGVS